MSRARILADYVSSGDELADKARLRNITKDADSCTTTDQLKALTVTE